MGFKSSSVAIAQTTRFKRKLYSSQNRSTANPFSPPATPFNNTSFLIQLQQRREQGRSTLTFDQYGSMENMIACCSFATSSTLPQLNHPQPPISGPSTSQSSSLSISQITGSPHRVQLNPDSERCDSESEKLNSCCSDDASSVPMRPKLEAHEGDGVLRHHHCHRQCFMDDNFDTQCADSGSQTGTSIKEK